MKQFLLFVMVPIILTTAGEFILKFSVNSLENPSTISLEETVERVKEANPSPESIPDLALSGLELFLNPKILFAYSIIIAGGVLWVIAMSKYELSFLYPFLSINYTAVIIGSQVFLGESVSIYRYLSVVFIIIGLIFISRSPYAEKERSSS